jgi:hypothetical protein
MSARIDRGVLLSGLGLAGLVLAGCAYDPPMRADHAAASYQKDLAACQEAGDKEADRRVMASGILFLTYPVSLPIEQRIQTRKCMEGKGYKLED